MPFCCNQYFIISYKMLSINIVPVLPVSITWINTRRYNEQTVVGDLDNDFLSAVPGLTFIIKMKQSVVSFWRQGGSFELFRCHNHWFAVGQRRLKGLVFRYKTYVFCLIQSIALQIVYSSWTKERKRERELVWEKNI